MKHLFTIVALFFTISQFSAQTKGKLTYTMDFSSDNPEMAMAVGMMEGSSLELSFIPEKTRASVQMGAFVKLNTITDSKAQKSLVLMDAMGSKTATFIDLKKVAEKKTVFSSIKPTAETKTIAGLKCTKTLLKDEYGVDYTVWSTKDIKVSTKGIEQLNQFPVDGVPVEFTLNSNEMNIHFLTTKFEKVVDENQFGMDIPEGYKEISQEELEAMGQM